MAVQITSTVRDSARLYRVTVTLTSRSVIASPTYYILHDADAQAELIAKAGLSSTSVFVTAILLSSSSVAGTYYYSLLVTLDALLVSATSHSHDCTTLSQSLRDAYRDDPSIDLDAAYGPVEIYAVTANTVDYLRVYQGSTNLLFIRKAGTIQLGAPVDYTVDTIYDFGSVDNGATLRRPRDVYVGRDAKIARSGYFGTSAKSPMYLFFSQATNPDNVATDRHLYWSTVDNKPHVWNGTIDYALDACANCPGTFGIYDGTAVALGDVVVMQGLAAVVKADAAVSSQNPVLGVCVSKPSVAVALVQFGGEVSTFTSSLTRGLPYFVSKTAGKVTSDISGFTSGDTVQLVGVSKTDSIMTLMRGIKNTLA